MKWEDGRDVLAGFAIAGIATVAIGVFINWPDARTSKPNPIAAYTESVVTNRGMIVINTGNNDTITMLYSVYRDQIAQAKNESFNEGAYYGAKAMGEMNDTNSTWRWGGSYDLVRQARRLAITNGVKFDKVPDKYPE